MTREEILKEALREFGTFDPPSIISNESITDFALAQIKKREQEIVEKLGKAMNQNYSYNEGIEAAIQIVKEEE